jgi:hypothetical protein
MAGYIGRLFRYVIATGVGLALSSQIAAGFAEEPAGIITIGDRQQPQEQNDTIYVGGGKREPPYKFLRNSRACSTGR